MQLNEHIEWPPRWTGPPIGDKLPIGEVGHLMGARVVKAGLEITIQYDDQMYTGIIPDANLFFLEDAQDKLNEIKGEPTRLAGLLQVDVV